MKPLVIACSLLVAIPVLSGPVVAATYEVAMTNYVFAPDSLSILVGDTVRWVCNQGHHTTTSGTNGTADGAWDSGPMAPGATFAHVFTEPGINPYFCAPHWQMGMVGVVMVRVAGTSESLPPSLPASPIRLTVVPSPCAGSATVTYSLPARSDVRLVIYDGAGRMIRSLVDGVTPGGCYQAVWHGDDDSGASLTAGVYFIRFEASGFFSVQNIVRVHR